MIGDIHFLHDRAAFFAMSAVGLRSVAMREPSYMRPTYDRMCEANVSLANVASDDASRLETYNGSVFPGVPQC